MNMAQTRNGQGQHSGRCAITETEGDFRMATATDVTFLVSDRGATAYLMLEGVKLLGIKEQGTWMFYEMDNSDGRAQELFNTWRDNSARVAPRAFSEKIREVNRLGKFN